MTGLQPRTLAKTGIAAALHWSGAARPLSAVAGWRSAPPVITYHRVVEDFAASARHTVPATLVSRQMLEAQLDWIGRRFRFVSLDELGSALEAGTGGTGPVAAITFDDGYRDVYEHALPLLTRKGIPAAVFVVTKLIGTSELQLHDRLYLLLARALSAWASARRSLGQFLAGLGVRLPDDERLDRAGHDPAAVQPALLDHLPQAEALRICDALEAEVGLGGADTPNGMLPLTWETLAELSRAGMTIGSHTKSHAQLTNEPPDKVADETAGSRRELEQRLGITVDHFAYPNGRFDSSAVGAVAASGYRFGYTICQHRDRTRPLLTIPRRVFWQNTCLNALGRFSSAMIRCQVTGAFDFGGRCKDAHARRQAAATRAGKAR
jgi:peptidoglycan/xylan/chitin deacetylase (PgdA/CDA1 family)